MQITTRFIANITVSLNAKSMKLTKSVIETQKHFYYGLFY